MDPQDSQTIVADAEGVGVLFGAYLEDPVPTAESSFEYAISKTADYKDNESPGQVFIVIGFDAHDKVKWVRDGVG